MSAIIVRGGACRLCFYPQGGLDVTTLGEPSIGVSQDLTFLTPDVVIDAENNRIYADLKERDTIQLVEGLETRVQAVYTNDDGEVVYRFPIHTVTVTDTIFSQFYEPEETYDDDVAGQEGA